MLSRRLFRLGPAILVPPMVVWAAICSGIDSRGEEWWRVYPFFGTFALGVLWHLALAILEKERAHYVGYALCHLPLLCLAAAISMIAAVGL
jgi:hypothetical protein